MFISCLHCRDLVAIDPVTRLPPSMCPRCGGQLQTQGNTADTPATRSLASLLQPAAAVDPPHTLQATVPPATDVEAANAPQPTQPGPAPEPESPPAPEHESGPQPGTQAADTEEPAPSFLRAASPSVAARNTRWQWALLTVLVLVLALQVVIADRARLAADPHWRPLLVKLCAALGCGLPDWRQPQAITMLSRDVRPAPGVAGGLRVEATFRNDAAWPQAWPQLLLSFSDADGRVVGARAFTPAEYLDKAATQTPLAPGQSARVGLLLREPGPDAVAFSFDFR